MTKPKTENHGAEETNNQEADFELELNKGLRLTALSELQAERLKHSEEVKKMILEDREKLKKLALVDPLTGAFNRGYLDDLMTKAVAREKRNKMEGRENKPFSVLMIDLDHFKQLNDNYGHEMGDKVLQAVVKIMKKNLERETDVLARYGGEEFVIVLENTDEEGATVVAERIRKSIEEETRKMEGLRKVTASIGHATHMADKNEVELADIVKSADSAAFKSKRAGRNQVTAYRKTDEKDMEAETVLEKSVKEAERHLPADPKGRIDLLEELLKKAKREQVAEKTGTNG